MKKPSYLSGSSEYLKEFVLHYEKSCSFLLKIIMPITKTNHTLINCFTMKLIQNSMFAIVL